MLMSQNPIHRQNPIHPEQYQMMLLHPMLLMMFH